MKLRTLGMTVVAALALVAGSARAQEAGWDTKYGILFTLPNPFNGHATGDNSLINDYDTLVGFQYNMGPQTALRIGANLLRDSCGRTITKNAAGVESKTVTACPTITGAPTMPAVATPGFNSQIGVTLTAEYLMRASTAAISPYGGVGASLGFDRWALSGKDETGGVTTDEFKNRAYKYSLGVGAKLGLEWRIHKVIALYAEYQAGLTLLDRTSTKVNETPPGLPAVKAESKQLDILNLETGIAHGGRLGVVAYF